MLKIFHPNQYVSSVEVIDLEKLKNTGIEALILDIDNTLADNKKNLSQSKKDWIYKVKKSGLKICFLSNSLNSNFVDNLSKEFDVIAISSAKKPMKSGFLKMLKKLNLKNSQVAVIGDQVFTDILGGNRLDIYTILVDRVEKKEIFITRMKRPFEKFVLRKYKGR